MERLPIYVALDNMDLGQCCRLIGKLGPRIEGVKINSLWHAEGPRVAGLLQDAGAPSVFVDLKLHDIPQTVGLCAKAVDDAGAQILTVHASGGIEMMQAAVARSERLHVLAITLLTSLDAPAANEIYAGSPEGVALRLARIAKEAGVWGVVCSPQELAFLKRPDRGLRNLKFYTPGIRLEGSDPGDQKRIGTPRQAIRDGAQFLVVGRDLTTASDPLAVLDQYQEEISRGHAERGQ